MEHNHKGRKEGGRADAEGKFIWDLRDDANDGQKYRIQRTEGKRLKVTDADYSDGASLAVQRVGFAGTRN